MGPWTASGSSGRGRLAHGARRDIPARDGSHSGTSPEGWSLEPGGLQAHTQAASSLLAPCHVPRLDGGGREAEVLAHHLVALASHRLRRPPQEHSAFAPPLKSLILQTVGWGSQLSFRFSSHPGWGEISAARTQGRAGASEHVWFLLVAKRFDTFIQGWVLVTLRGGALGLALLMSGRGSLCGGPSCALWGKDARSILA